MKKNLFFAVFACACLASCVNESENLLEESKGKRLTFGAPVMYNQSRAVVGEINGDAYPDDESFTVFGIEHKGDFAGWEATNVIKDAQGNGFFPAEGEVVTKSQTENYWYTSTDYYLPTEPDHKLSFAAYSPSRANGTISYGADGLTITDWRMPDAAADMYDLMYSTRSLNQKQAEIPIAFLHALSSIHIQFAMAEKKYNGPSSVVVTNVAIKGEGINNVGTFNDNIATKTDGTGAAWTDLKAITPSTKYVIFNGTFNVGTGAAEPETSTDFLPIPQDVENQTLLISYQIKMKGDAAYQVVEDLEIPFSAFEVNDEVITKNWARATRYFYTVTFGGLTKIKFSPSVEGWTDVEDAGTYVIQ